MAGADADADLDDTAPRGMIAAHAADEADELVAIACHENGFAAARSDRGEMIAQQRLPADRIDGLNEKLITLRRERIDQRDQRRHVGIVGNDDLYVGIAGCGAESGDGHRLSLAQLWLARG